MCVIALCVVGLVRVCAFNVNSGSGRENRPSVCERGGVNSPGVVHVCDAVSLVVHVCDAVSLAPLMLCHTCLSRRNLRGDANYCWRCGYTLRARQQGRQGAALPQEGGGGGGAGAGGGDDDDSLSIVSEINRQRLAGEAGGAPSRGVTDKDPFGEGPR